MLSWTILFLKSRNYLLCLEKYEEYFLKLKKKYKRSGKNILFQENKTYFKYFFLKTRKF